MILGGFDIYYRYTFTGYRWQKLSVPWEKVEFSVFRLTPPAPCLLCGARGVVCVGA